MAVTPAPDSLVPGISKYPDLMAKLVARLARETCCNYSTIAASFRKKLEERRKRDKDLKLR